MRGGPEVGLKITHGPTPDPATGEINLERTHWWMVWINGKESGEPTIAPPTRMFIGREIEQTEYDFLVADRAWAAKYSPQAPEATPDKKIDIRKLPLPF